MTEKKEESQESIQFVANYMASSARIMHSRIG